MDMKFNTEASIDMIAEELAQAWKESEGVYDLKIKCAMLLLKLREQCGTNDNLFREMLDEHDVIIGKNERAAMIKFAKMPETERLVIERQMRKNGNVSFNWVMQGVSPSGDTSPSRSELSQSPAQTTVSSENDSQNESENKREKAKPSKSYENRKRADEVANIVKDWSQRSFVLGGDKDGKGGVHPKHGWPLLLEAMDMEMLSEKGASVAAPSGRCLFNLKTTQQAVQELGGYDLSKQAGCTRATEELMPFLRRNADALKADPTQFMPLMMAERAAKSAEKEATRKAQQMAEITMRGEKPVAVAGIQVWPHKHSNYKTYSYEQLRQAWFIFLDAESIAQAPSHTKNGRKSRAIGHRFMANKIERMGVNMNDEDKEHMHFVMLAYREIVLAMEDGPDDDLLTAIPWNDIKGI